MLSAPGDQVDDAHVALVGDVVSIIPLILNDFPVDADDEVCVGVTHHAQHLADGQARAPLQAMSPVDGDHGLDRAGQLFQRPARLGDRALRRPAGQLGERVLPVKCLDHAGADEVAGSFG